MALFPIELELEGRAALVVGLGEVGRRRAARLAELGARVVGVDPAAGDGPFDHEVRRERYRRAHLRGMALAVAAGPPRLNRRVVADARAARVWVGSASDPSGGDFLVPAAWRSGPLIVTVSTSGASPALAAALLARAAEALGPAAAGVAAIMAELRPLALRAVADPVDRRRLLADWADPAWLELWAREGPESVRRELLRRIRASP